MGNRAVITKEGATSNDTGIYVHWNGGPESVLAFIHTCKDRGYRGPKSDNCGLARLTGVIHEFFAGDGLSVGIGRIDDLDCDNFDNGVYEISDSWEIVKRWGKGSGNCMNVSDLSEREAKVYNGIKEELKASNERLCKKGEE